MSPPLTTESEKRKQITFLRKIEWIFLSFFLIVALAVYVNIQRVIVHGRSMEPTLHNGDALIAWKTAPRDKLNTGDVIVFRDNDGFELIKRIIFVQNAQGTVPPPEYIQIPGGVRPFKTLFRDYNASVAAGRLPRPSRENTIYVMGDNTDNSEDSRVFGPIRPDQVVGKVFVKDIGP